MTETHDNATATSQIGPGRLEVLVDGIFAIAMTILVLELKVPEGLADRRSVAELAAALAHSIATFGSYLLSFGVLGVMWYRHNVSFRHLRHINGGMLALQLVQLALAAFFPFCAALFGRYHSNPLTMVFYVGCIDAYLWASLTMWAVAHRCGAISPQLGEDLYRRSRNRTLRGCVVLTVLLAAYLINALAG